MNISSETITGRNVVFDLILEDFPGGASFDLSNIPADIEWIDQGTPVYLDKSARVAYAVKTSAIAVSGTSSGFYVSNDNLWAVADVMFDGTSGAAISSITASGDYDYIVLAANSLVTYVTNTVLKAGLNVSGDLYTANGFVKDTINVGTGAAKVDNAECSVVLRGAVRNGSLPYPLSTAQKTSLAHFTFNT